MKKYLWLIISVAVLCNNPIICEDEKETNLGEVLFDDQKVQLYFIQGNLSPTNWSYFELKWKGPVRIILDSTAGDADLYLSFKQKQPGYDVHEHEMLSATCGLDVIDVPQSFRRPAYVGVYGHPSKIRTRYHMLIVMMEERDSEFMDPINIAPDMIYSLRDDVISDKNRFREVFFATIRIMLEILVEVLL